MDIPKFFEDADEETERLITKILFEGGSADPDEKATKQEGSANENKSSEKDIDRGR